MMKLFRLRACETLLIGLVFSIGMMAAPSSAEWQPIKVNGNAIQHRQRMQQQSRDLAAVNEEDAAATGARTATTQHSELPPTTSLLQETAREKFSTATQHSLTSPASSLRAEDTTNENPTDDTKQQHHYYQPKLRGSRRRLPGAYDGFDIDFESAEAGFAVGVLLFVVLVLLLCCCCCGAMGRGRGGGCGLWDIVACLCIWEMCCDRDGAAFNDFQAF